MPGASFQIVFSQSGQSGQSGQSTPGTPTSPVAAFGPGSSFGSPTGSTTAPQAAPASTAAFQNAAQIVAAIDALPAKIAAAMSQVQAAANPAAPVANVAPSSNPTVSSPVSGQQPPPLPQSSRGNMDQLAAQIALNGYRVSQLFKDGGFVNLANNIARLTTIFDRTFLVVTAIEAWLKARAAAKAVSQTAQTVSSAANAAPAAENVAGQVAAGAAPRIAATAAAPEAGVAAAGAGLTALTAAIPPLALAIAALTAIVTLAVFSIKYQFQKAKESAEETARAINDFRVRMREMTQHLAALNPQIAMSAATAEIANINQQIRRGNQLAPGLAEFTKTNNEMLIRVDRVATQVDRIKLEFLNPILRILNKGAAVIDPLLAWMEGMTIDKLKVMFVAANLAGLRAIAGWIPGLGKKLDDIIGFLKLFMALMPKPKGDNDTDKAIDQFLNPAGADPRKLGARANIRWGIDR